MFRNYLTTTLRSLIKYKGYSFINIAGLAIGMACSVLIMLWVVNELSYDRYNQDSDRIYRLVQTQYYSSGPLTTVCMPGPIAKDLVEQYPEIEDGFMYYVAPGAVVSYGEKIFNENIRLAQPGLFRLFDFDFIGGDPATALDDLYSIVITREMAEKYFADGEAMGKVLRLNDEHNFKVSGVIENIPDNSSFRFDFCIPFEFLEELGMDLDRYGWNSYYTYILLDKNTTEEAVEEKILKHIQLQGDPEDESNIDLWLHPLHKIHLYSVRGGGPIQQVYILSIVAVFILLIACINFMNLATARSSRRAREIGLRKVVGATKGKVLVQFLIDSVFLAFISAIFAIIIVLLFMPAFNQLADTNLNFSLLDPVNILILLVVSLITGLLAGSYPAFYLSGFNPLKVLRVANSGTKGSALFRKILVVFQFGLSVILIIATIVIIRQQHYMQQKDLGLKTENVVYIEMEGSSANNFDALKTELERDPSVLGVTRASALPFLLGSNSGGFDWQDRDVDNDVLVGFAFADYDYDKVLDIELIHGRFYDRNYATDTSEGIVINESMLRTMNMSEPIGKWVSWGENRWNIIGVMKDFHFLPLTFEISPLVMLFSHRNERTRVMMVRIGDDPLQTIEHIGDVWERVNPSFPFNYNFLDVEYQELYDAETRLGQIFKYFALLAIFISCLGLLGLASFMAEQRTREIGIRKTFGAPVRSIVLLMSKEFAYLVIIANLIAIPVAYYFLSEWLSNYSYAVRLSADTFIAAFVISMIIAILTIIYQSIKAAYMDPVKAIKYE
jgi:predicted permease